VRVGGCDLAYCGDRIDVVGNYAYVTTGGGSLDVIDVHDPTQPVRVGTFRATGVSDAVKAVGNFAYVASGRYFHVVEVRLPLRLNPPVYSGDNICLSWNGAPGIKLQKTASLSAPIWEDVPGSDGVSQIELPCTGPAAFFRLTKH
jgi:hypothetical protein